MSRGLYDAPAAAAAVPSGGGGLGKALVVVGLGAAAWYFWPRLVRRRDDRDPRSTLEALARERGFSSARSYEDAVIATLRELQAAGAKIELGPHLWHLAQRLEESPPRAVSSPP